MACLDTNFFVEIFRKEPSARAKLIQLRNNRESICTTIVTIAELYYGAYNSKKKSAGLKQVTSVLNTLRVLDLDVVSAEKYGELSAEPVLKAQPIKAFDLLIASIALINNENVILTKDEHFNHIPNIKAEQW